MDEKIEIVFLSVIGVSYVMLTAWLLLNAKIQEQRRSETNNIVMKIVKALSGLAEENEAIFKQQTVQHTAVFANLLVLIRDRFIDREKYEAAEEVQRLLKELRRKEPHVVIFDREGNNNI